VTFDSQLTAYVVFTTLLVITPGASTAVVVRNVLDGGRQRGIAAAAGALVGNASYAAAAGLGIATLFARVPVLFAGIRVAGAVYLGLLGVQSLFLAWRLQPSRLPGGQDRKGTAAVDRSRRSGFSQGLVTSLLNPAVATFYLTVVPSFLPARASMPGPFVLLATIHVLMAFSFHSLWVLALDAMRSTWGRPSTRRAIETLTGITLLALAARVW
jgi:threonine/homoserine/homoserine lactone efflux protein